MESSGSGESGGVDPQFQMFDESPNENEIGSIPFEGDDWAVVLQTRECADRLFRGKFLFRSKGRELRTADLFIEATDEEVVERASNFEEHLIRDLLRSLL
ncbi:MAG: hypothetical protein JSV86_19990 [Gemmatimonadota bacterium]|nr:MAG: hypothetical protein JSV86_19990 [Gemmatimonadota bacterium]